MSKPPLTPLIEQAIERTRAAIRRRLDNGETPEAIRSRTEAELTRRLTEISESDPLRQTILDVHAHHQQVVDEAIRVWEAEQSV